MADPLSITAGVVGLLAFAGSTLTKGYSILQSLQDSKNDVNQLLIELSQMTGILVAIEAQEKESNKRVDVEKYGANAVPQILDSSISSCREMLEKVWNILHKLEKSRRAVLAIKWQFLEPDVKKLIQEIERYKTIFILCLGVDVRKKTDQMLELQIILSAQIDDLRDEKEKEKRAAQEERARSNRNALMRWLVPKSDESHEKALKLWATGTGKWLIEHADFISWVEGPHSLLWLNGIPGSGKTILMSHVVENLKARSSSSNEPRGLAYFYCTYNTSENHGMSYMLGSLAAQLIRIFPQPETGPAMRLFRECNDGTLAAKVDHIQNLLCDLINDMEVVFICLDALDECSLSTKSELLSFIYMVIGRCDNVKIIVSSRSGDSEVSEFLDGCPSITITPQAVARDIDLYVRRRIDRGPKRLKQAQSEYMVDRLTSGAEGMFLWVSYQMDQLSLINTTAGVHHALTSLPRGLSGTYNQILDRILPENEILATRALRWLAHAMVPLGLIELVEAIAVDESTPSLDGLQKIFVPEDIFQICGSLVRRSEVTGMLSLAHSSVYDFLTVARSESHPPSPYYIPLGPSKVVLFKTCLIYLSFPDFNMAMMQAKMDPHSYEESTLNIAGAGPLADCPFFDYALRNWWKHLPITQEDLDEVWPSLIQFFNTESGNFGSLIMLLHHLEGTYKYPMAILPIHFCATHGLDLVLYRLLNENITDLECKVEDGRTALHIAIENGHKHVVQHLLTQGANADAKSADGRTPLQLALESGNESIAELLILKGADVNANFASGETPLSVAVGNHWTSLVQLLLRQKANSNMRLPDGRTSLHVAAEVGSSIEITKMLCDGGADPTFEDDKSWTALHYAAHYGHEAVASMLVKAKKIDKVFNRIEWTPLHAAIEQEKIEIVRLLARFAKNVSTKLIYQKEGQKLLHQTEGQSLASISPSRSIFSKTSRPAEDIGEASASRTRTSPPTASMKSEPIITPLFLATSQEYIVGVDALMEAGVDSKDVKFCIEHAYTKGKMPVMQRLVSELEKPMELLLSLSEKVATSPGQSRMSTETLFKCIQWNRNNIPIAMQRVIKESRLSRLQLQLLKLLIDQFFHLDDGPQKQTAEQLIDVLKGAVECGCVQAMEMLRAAGVELSGTITAVLGRDEPGVTSYTLLHHAVRHQKPQMTSYFLKFIKPDVVDTRGRTPLHYAFEENNSSAQVLLSHGADISSRDNKGWTPLHVASYYGVGNGVSSLLDAGAEVDARDNAGMTPLDHCAFSSHSSLRNHSGAMTILHEAGASFSSLNRDGCTPLEFAMITAIRTHSKSDLSSILNQQTDLISSKLPPLDRTPLHFAAEASCGSPILLTLVSRGADLEAEDKDGKTPVQVAANGARQLLINMGARWRA